MSTPRAGRRPGLGAQRLIAVACLFMLISGLCWKSHWIVTGGWTKYTPTPLLTITTRRIPSWTPPGVRSELRRRFERGTLTESQQGRLISAAIANLGDDNARWNADWALALLQASGEAAIPILEETLRSPDRQRRQLAAHLLRERWHDGSGRYDRCPALPPYLPPNDLFRVTVEGLADDELGDRHGAGANNAFDGFVFLVENAPRAGAFLEPGLDSQDVQQRFLSAVAAGFCACGHLLDKAAPILVEHLRATSTAIGGDGAAATRALYLFGPCVLPYVRPLSESADRQQADLARLIVMDLETPGRPIDQRRALNSVTNQVQDPATDLTLEGVRSLLY